MMKHKAQREKICKTHSKQSCKAEEFIAQNRTRFIESFNFYSRKAVLEYHLLKSSYECASNAVRTSPIRSRVRYHDHLK